MKYLYTYIYHLLFFKIVLIKQIVDVNFVLEHFSNNHIFGMPQMDSTKNSQEEIKITSSFENTLLEKSNIILLGPTGCGLYFFF